MKKVWRFLSYVIVAALSTAITLAAVSIATPGGAAAGSSKLDQLEALIEERFIGEVDKTAIEDAAAVAMVDALGDRWSYYIAAKDYRAYTEQMANAYVGKTGVATGNHLHFGISYGGKYYNPAAYINFY